MRTIYLKNNSDYPYSFPYFYKVIETLEGSEVLTVTEEKIEREVEDDFFSSVSFIKETLCKETGCEEITREKFDAFFVQTVSKINRLTAA